VSALDQPDVRDVEALARMHLLAGRCAYRLELCHAGSELRELLDLVGLRQVLRVEARGEAEQREQVLGVEEERDPPEPVP
jgi:hypothetical protein